MLHPSRWFTYSVNWGWMSSVNLQFRAMGSGVSWGSIGRVSFWRWRIEANTHQVRLGRKTGVVVGYFRFRSGRFLSSGLDPQVCISCRLTSCLAGGFRGTGRTSAPSGVRTENHYGYFRLTFVVRTSHDERRRGTTSRRGVSRLAGGFRITSFRIHGGFYGEA